ncbi:hypothetical protein J7643_06585 [bacterium]|nr:hypothetical protein [bacterium]
MAYLIPHNEPAISVTLDLHEALLIVDALMERRKERFGQPFPEGSEVTFEQLVAAVGTEEDAEDFLAMMELEAALIDTLQVFEEADDEE